VVLFAEYARSILLVTLLAGAAGAAYRYVVPGSYESLTIIKGASSATPTLLMSPALLAPVARDMGLDKGRPFDEALENLRARIKVAFNAREELASISVRWSSEEGAQKLATLLWTQLAAATAPRGPERAKLEEQLKDIRSRVTEVNEGIALLRARLAQPGQATGSEFVQGYALLIQTGRALATERATLEKQLRGLDESHLVQPPTRPSRPSGASAWTLASVAAVVGG
jgi:uncharacterized protein involved in exopolysaccharide biosynthesis